MEGSPRPDRSQSGNCERRFSLVSEGALPPRQTLSRDAGGKPVEQTFNAYHLDKHGWRWWGGTEQEKIEFISFQLACLRENLKAYPRAGTARCWQKVDELIARSRRRAAMPEDKHQLFWPEEAPSHSAVEARLSSAWRWRSMPCFFAWLGNEVLQGDTQHFDQGDREGIHHFASPGMTRVMIA